MRMGMGGSNDGDGGTRMGMGGSSDGDSNDGDEGTTVMELGGQHDGGGITMRGCGGGAEMQGAQGQKVGVTWRWQLKVKGGGGPKIGSCGLVGVSKWGGGG